MTGMRDFGMEIATFFGSADWLAGYRAGEDSPMGAVLDMIWPPMPGTARNPF